jgi:signal transduction histidine kinase
VTAFAPPVPAGKQVAETKPTKPNKKAKRPARWSLSNWPVRWKVLAIVLVPIALAGTFGGMRIYNSITDYRDLRLAADRAQLVYPIENFMSAMDGVLLASAGVGDPPSALRDFDARRSELQQRLADTNVAPGVRSGITAVLNGGQGLRDQVASNSVNVRQQVIEYAPLLLAAEDAISSSVRVDDEAIRAQAQGLSRAVGHRGQMLMLQLLVSLGGQLAEPELRTSMITVAGTEPSTVIGLGQLLGAGSPEMVTLREQMVRRMAIMSDPTSTLVDNPDLKQSLQTSDQIINKVINDTTASVTKAVDHQASASRTAAIRDSAIVVAAIVAALLLVVWVARSLVRPLRKLRAGALQVAHEDLAREIERVRAGQQPAPIEPIPVHTSEEVGQVAHAVDELHEQALLMAGEQAALQLQVADMFETLSRRSRSLVDQQLSLIDRLERNEEDPDRLDSLFKLDHLAARMRRNGTNLLVLSGANIHREQADPIALASVINAAASEVEDYRRVTTSTVPDSAIAGSAAGDVIHLLAELMDNALRYSPPTSPVRVSAVHTGKGGLVIEVSDSGLGMTESDLRMANMRLKSGGEVTPYTARHMGLYVVGRLAQQHGLVVRLRSSVAGEPGSGTTAGVYVPAELTAHAGAHRRTGPGQIVDLAEPAGNGVAASFEQTPDEEFQTDPDLFGEPYVNGSGPTDASVSMLPRRTPGASGITGIPAEPQEPEPTRTPTDTSSYFSSRAQVTTNGTSSSVPHEPESDDVAAQPPEHAAPAAHAATSDDDESPIFQRMVSEWLVDFDTLTAPPQDWKSVWDHGWAAAAHADEAPVQRHTDSGLPIREPGARLVPGSAEPDTPQRSNGAHAKPDEGAERSDWGIGEVASGSGFGYGRHELGPDQAPLRDPNAVRTSISNHFGGVHAGRSHAREANEGMDTE